MSFTQDNKIVIRPTKASAADAAKLGKTDSQDESLYSKFSVEGKESRPLTVYATLETENIFEEQDYSIIIKTFEIETSNWEKEDYALAYHYKDVYSTRNFSERVREQMNYYPGMHQTASMVPSTDPFYKNAKEKSDERLGYWDGAMDSPDSFMDGLRNKQQDIDYSKIFGSDASAKTRAKNLGSMLLQCVPCFDRIMNADNLLPDGDLLEIHALNIKIRTDLLDKLKSMFKDPGFNIDICELLKLLSGLCPQDLLAILALLTQYLAKLNLDVQFNIDFIIQLIGPILSPFLDAISAWLDKWIQMILEPLICIVDHINEVIMIGQNFQIPFSQVTGNVGADIGIAAPGHRNISRQRDAGVQTGVGSYFGDKDASKFGVGSSSSWDHFHTPNAQKYNPEIPDLPDEEFKLAFSEGVDPWQDGKNTWVGDSNDIAKSWSPGISEAEREERNKQWNELKERQLNKRQKVPPPLTNEKRNGQRWSKDDVPQSDKYSSGSLNWEAGAYHPPEKQQTPQASGTQYVTAAPLVNSIVQLRNILQGGIQYVKDWFTYVTQMIYDLLGVDFGWMDKKADTTMLKSRIIQLIMLVKSIFEAISKNGLECGADNNFDPAQLKFITEEVLNRDSQYQFEVQPSGTVIMTPPSRTGMPAANTLDQQGTKDNSGTGDSLKAPTRDRQEAVDSSIIIKTCFKDVTSDELAKVRTWISDFEGRK